MSPYNMVPFLNQIFLYGGLAVFFTLASGLIPVIRHWNHDHLHSFVSFSAGVLIATAFMHLLPEAVERSDATTVGVCILGSFVTLFILEKFIMLHPCEEAHCDYHTMGLAAFFGLLIHTFFDGLSLGASFRAEESLVKIVFFAIMMHKIPSSFALGSILKKAKWPSRKIALFIAIFGAVIPLGAASSFFMLEQIGEKAVGIALALSLGTFIYISTSDFLPEVHRAHSKRMLNLAAFLIGIFLAGVMPLFLPGHGH